MKLLKKLVLSIMLVLATVIITINIIPELESIYTVEAASIKINKTKKTLYVGESYTLKIKGTSKKVKWSSSNTKVAKVNSKGKVTAKKNGTATITAKVGNKKYTCKVKVKNPYINKTSKTLKVGEGYNLEIVGATQKIKWSSSNTKVAKVTSNGRVIANKKGTATITAKVGNKKYTCIIKVKNLSFSNVDITPTKLGNSLLLKLKNNNDYAVDIRIEGKFYNNNGKKVGEGNHYNYALEANSESIMKIWSMNKGKEKSFSSYKLSLDENNNANNKKIVTKVNDYKKIHNANAIRVQNVVKNTDFYSVVIKNTSYSTLNFVNIGMVFYDKDGKIIGAESKSIPDYRISYLQCKTLKYNFPKNNKGKTIKPASYKVYVNYAYKYTN